VADRTHVTAASLLPDPWARLLAEGLNMNADIRKHLLGYGVAVLGVAGAILLRGLLDPLLGNRLPLATLYGASAVAVWYGGYRPGLLATALGYLAASYLFIEPRGSIAWKGASEVAGLILYLLSCLLIIVLGEAMQVARRRAETNALKAAHQQKHLRVTEERFGRFMQHLPGLAWIKDVQGRYVFANDAAVQAFRTPRAKLYGKTDEEIFPPETAAQFQKNDQRALAAGTGVQVIETLEHEDGVLHYSLVSKFPIPGPDGALSLVGGMAIDITDQKQTEEELRRRAEETEKLMDLVPLGVFLAQDPACGRITGNQAGYELLRLPVGSNLSVTPPAGEAAPFTVRRNGQELPPDQLPMQYAAAHAVEVRDVEVEHVYPDGTTYTLFGSASPLFDAAGKVRGCVAAFLDLSERKRLEAELRQRVEQLAEADRRKDEFLAMLAHELRNPLAPIRSCVQILRLLGPADAHLQRAEEMIERQVQHLTRLVDDLLDVSRITRGKITLQKERLDLAAVVARAVETSRPQIEFRRHELAVMLPQEPVWVEGDGTRLAQVFANLLNNAAKNTPDAGHIRLLVEAGPGTGVVRVRDDGLGIPADLLPRVFDLFTQGDRSLARSEGGLGIGLTMVKSIVEMHGGTVEARSAGLGQGSEFVVRLPAAPGESALAARDGRGERLDRPASHSRRVLVVDDNHDAAASLAMVLRIDGHDVRTAQDGPAALQEAELFRPEAILLDIGLPQMDGYEVARRLRGQVGLNKALLVALTGYGQDEDRRRAKEAGFDAHLTKPADAALLQRLLAGL